MQNVLVIFQATQQETESLALALGLGAVQQGANIRLRHLDPSPEAKMAHAGYGTLKSEDLRWAGAVAVLLETLVPEHLGTLEILLGEIAAETGTADKWSFVVGGTPGAESVYAMRAMLSKAGLKRLVHEPEPKATSLEFMNQVGARLASLP